MKVKFLTNAMVLLEGKDSTVLSDPWVTFDNYSSSGFYNFPKCALTKDEVAAIKPDFIYISHTHPDHFDPITLELFSKDTPILISYYQHNFTEQNIRRLGFTDIRVSSPTDGIALNGTDHCWIEPAEYSPEVDSVAVFQIDGKKIINVNDNTFAEAQCQSLKDRYGPFYLGLIPSGAHGPWPMFYNMSESELERHAKERRENQKASFLKYVSILDPDYVIPFAGGIICAGEKAKRYKYSGINPRSEVVKYALEHHNFIPILLSEGQSYDFDKRCADGVYKEKTFETEKAYIDELAAKNGKYSFGGEFYVSKSDRIDLTRLLKMARQNQLRWQKQREVSGDGVFYIDVGDDRYYRLSLADAHVERVDRDSINDEWYEIFHMPYELLLGLITRHYVWSNVNTQHMSFTRKGAMNKELLVLMNYFQV